MKILIADDVPTELLLLKIVLEKEGYQVETAHCGLTALEKIKTQSPDLAIIDVAMPNLSGIDIAMWVREHNLDIPILLVSGYYDVPEIELQKYELKVADWIHKPINIDQLLSKISLFMK